MTGSTLYTVGHSNHTMEHFLDLLRVNGVEVVADVRTRPYSSYSPHFSRQPLEHAVRAAGFRYVFMGKELGGQPEGERFYDERGHALYHVMAREPIFHEGLARLREGMAKHRVAVMCSEEDPSMCHRRHLITRVLHDEGVVVRHIRGDGRVELEGEIRAQEATTEADQLGLFSEIDAQEKDERWKSIQSGLRKNPPPNSSDY